jgi:hypothetical protein
MKEENKKIEKGKEEKGIVGISTPYPLYTAWRSCFVKRSSEMISASPPNPLHWHRHSRSCHSHSHNRAKRTLS